MEREEEAELTYWAERCGLAEKMKLAMREDRYAWHARPDGSATDAGPQQTPLSAAAAMVSRAGR